jgi:hypothetical protein
VFLLRIMKPFFRNRIIRKARRNLFPLIVDTDQGFCCIIYLAGKAEVIAISP